MRKIILPSLAIVCFVFMFSFALAQEAKPLKMLPQTKPSPVDYVLPYPGILPDNPLFVFKNIRDKILILLISNPIRKTEFRLLLADKNLSSGIMLLDKNKPEMAIITFNKAVASLNLAEKYLFEIPGSERSQTANIKDKFEKSVLKHQEVLLENMTKFDENKQQEINRLLDTLNTLSQDFQKKK